MSSETITRNDLANILNEVMPYDAQAVTRVYQGSSYNCTTANSMIYTGVSVTIPANCFYVISARATFSNAKPLNVSINTSPTDKNANVATGEYSDVMCTCTHSSKSFDTPITFYVWAKYNATANSAGNVYIDGWYIKTGLRPFDVKTRTIFTPTTGSSYASYGGCFYEVSGNLVRIHLGISGLTANTGVTVYTMPEDLRPDVTAFAQGTSGSMNSQVICEVGTDGLVRVYPSSTYCGCDIWYYL